MRKPFEQRILALKIKKERECRDAVDPTRILFAQVGNALNEFLPRVGREPLPETDDMREEQEATKRMWALLDQRKPLCPAKKPE